MIIWGSAILEKLKRSELEELLRMTEDALSDPEKLDALKKEIEDRIGRVLSRSDAVRYAVETRDLIRQRIELGVGENDNRRK